MEIPITQLPNYESKVLPQLDTLVTKFGYQIPSQDFFKACGNTLNTIQEQAKGKLPGKSFWSLVIDNLIALNWEEYNFKKDKWKAETIRDKQMFLNLKWISQSKYPNQKIIVWAANTHIARNKTNKYSSMGQYLFSDTSLGKYIYSIGFTSYEGEGGRLSGKKYKIDKPKNNSLESWINDLFQYAFIDFSVYNKTFPTSDEKFYMRDWRYFSFKNEWNKIYNGIFFIREMYPCKENKTAAYIGLQQVGLKE